MKNLFLVRLAFIFVLFSAYRPCFGQTLQIVPPTPNAMKMTEYYAQRPNLYTGTANVSIPLYTIDFDGWQLPLSVSYNATGIRTNEEASEVGLGWALNATGVISRTIVGADDLFKAPSSGRGVGYVYNARPVTYAMGWDRNVTPVSTDTSYYSYLVQLEPDTQPDIFNYNFFGNSGSFVLSQKAKDPLGPIKVIKVTENADSIVFDENNQTFTVTTSTGYKGEFTVKEKSTTFSVKEVVVDRMMCCEEGKIEIAEAKNNSGRFRTTTSWYLSKITSPRGQTITFNYELNVAETGTTGSTYPVGSMYSPYLSNSIAFSELSGLEDTEACLQTVHEHVYLSNIISDEVRVNFLMEDREDLRKNVLFTSPTAAREFPNSLNLKRYKSLNIIGLNSGSTLNKSITFVQNYFNQQYHKINSNDLDEVLWLRSRLDRIKIDDQEYSFRYENGLTGLPEKLTTGIDHFGFYSGNDSKTGSFTHNGWSTKKVMLSPELAYYTGGGTISYCDTDEIPAYTYYKQYSARAVNFDYGIAGLLKTVIYPTKGYSTFEYEPHRYLPQTLGDFLEIPGEKNAGGARIKAIKDYDHTQTLQRHKAYRYIENSEATGSGQSPTTGILMTPLYNRFTFPQYLSTVDKTKCQWYYSTNSSIPGNNSAEGKVIGYSKVHEVVIGQGNYKNTYYFENKANKVLDFNTIADGQPNLNGQVIQIRNYDSNGKIQKITENQDYNHQVGSIKEIAHKKFNQKYLEYWITHDIKRSFNTPYTVVSTTASVPSGIVDDANGNIQTWGNYVQTKTDYTFNRKFLLKTQKFKNSNGEEFITEFKRPTDYSATLQIPLSTMVERNIVEPVVEEIVRKDGQVISAKATRFTFENGKFNLRSIYLYNNNLNNHTPSSDGITFHNSYELKEDYTKYDGNSGKLLEYKGSDDLINSFVWGYNNKLPIVHGIGLTYDQLNQAHTASIGSADYETGLRNHANTVGKLITTFSHNPQVGLIKTTNPAGLKTTYDYDLYGRLQRVLDKDGNTQAQYEYHFKERLQTRILKSLGDLNFGTLIPDIFEPNFLEHVGCSSWLGSRILTLSNDGEDDLKIDRLDVPDGFSSSWEGGIIAPQTSVDVIITFIGTQYGSYAGNIVIVAPNKTAGPSQVAVSATYGPRDCNVAVSSTLVDFVTTDGFAQKFLDVTNSGNAPIRLIDALLDWDGSVNYNSTQFTHPDFTVSRTPTCIDVGQSVRLTVLFLPKGFGPTSTDLSLRFDECPAKVDVVKIQGNRQRPGSNISMDTNPIHFGSFTEPYKTKTLTLTNSGNIGFTFMGLGVSNPAVASYFSVSPASFVLEPNASQEVVLTFAPIGFDENVSTNITFGNATVAVTGVRYSSKVIQLSANALSFDGPTFSPQIVTISNVGNDNLNISGVSIQSIADWAATVTPTTLAPGQTTALSIMKKVSSPSVNPANITVLSNKNGGNEIVQVSASTRIINLSSVTFSSFTGAASTQPMTISNTGNSALSITSISSSNSRFVVSPSSFTLAAGAQQVVNITYTPTDFSLQSTTLTVNSNATSGTNTKSVSAQRTQNFAWTVSPTSLVVRPWNSPQTSYIVNTGNVPVTINSISNSAPSVFTVNYLDPTSSGDLSLPCVLQPGAQIMVNVRYLATGSGTLTIFPSSGSVKTITLTGATF